MVNAVIKALLKGNTLYMQQTSDEAISAMEEKLAELKQANANGTDDADYAE